jgi:hypothetical protein
VRGLIGNVVRWQAAGSLTPLWFSQWRTKAALGEVAKRHAKLIVKPLEDVDFQYAREQPCCFYRLLSSSGMYLSIFQIFRNSKTTKNGAILKTHSLFRREFLSLTTCLLNFKANITCKWWPLQHRIGWHTPGNRVHALLFVICFSSDEMT